MKWIVGALSVLALGLIGLAATCEEGGAGAGDPSSPATDRTVVDAPIDELDVLTLESFPVQYNVRIVSGLPSGCAEFEKAEITGRGGNTINIRVTNSLPADPNVACTAIYGTRETTLPLGTDFAAGENYTVQVNDRSVSFTAQ